MEKNNWGPSIFKSDYFDAVNAYLYDNFSIRWLSSSRLCVYVDDSPSVDAKGNKISVWKCFRCICGRDIDGGETCPVKFLYKYNDNHCFEAFQSEGEHTASSSSGSCKKRKLTELPENVQNAFVSMVVSGGQPANMVDCIKHKSLKIQKEYFPEEIYQVIIVFERTYIKL
jgi:hypothetical protein